MIIEEKNNIEETPAEETPAEAAPAEETPAEAAPAEETPEEESNNIEYSQVSIFGKKIGMSRVFLDEGDFDCPVTVVSAGPCHVTQLKTVDKEGYNSVQISYEEVKESKASKPMLGHFKKSGAPVSRMLKEFKVEDIDNFTIGAEINVSAFKVGDKVRVVGKSIGRGFAGHMKRHGFGGGRASHGKNSVMRKAGSIGAGSDPSRVWKGTRMAGRMGGDNITIKNLSIVKIDVENNLLYVSGSVPGANKGLLFISKR